jgi:hypothetical protein
MNVNLTPLGWVLVLSVALWCGIVLLVKWLLS